MLLSVNIQSDNSITLSKYRPIEKKYLYFNSDYKYNVKDKIFEPWTSDDIKRVCRSFDSSLARSRKALKELSALNKFDYFVTITFNKKYVNRKSALEVYHLYKLVIKRLRYNFNGLKYLAVSEFHEDAESIHFHCFMSFGRRPKLYYQGMTKKLHPYYILAKSERKMKIEDCFLTFEKITEEQPIHYLLKYMTKNYAKPLHRRYMSSRGLNKVHRIVSHRIKISRRDFERLDALEDMQWYGYAISPTYRYTEDVRDSQGAQSAPDLSKNNIKGENVSPTLVAKYYEILEYLLTYGKLVEKRPKVEENLPF